MRALPLVYASPKATRNTTCFEVRDKLLNVKRPLMALVLSLLAVMSGPAQTSKDEDPQQVLALIKEVQAQQAQIADNQAKIEAKLAELAEAIRVARIYSSRSR
jgi:hypothetical protein